MNRSDTLIRSTLADQVAERILRQIAEGHLEPGESLPAQRALARDMGVGMSVIREAIQRLQMLKVVKVSQGRGTVVNRLRWTHFVFEPSLRMIELEWGMLQHIWEARTTIECRIAGLAAERADEGALRTVERVLTEAGEAVPDFEENQRLNREFHLALANAAGNPVLVDMLSPLLEVNMASVRRIFDEEISRRTWAVHRQIYDEVARADARGAVLAMERHQEALAREMKRVRELLQKRRVA